MNANLRFSNQASFIWEMLLVFFLNKSTTKVIEIVSSMYEQEFTFSESLEGLLGKLWEESNSAVICDIAKQALKQGLFSTEQHYYVVSMLLDNSAIDIDEALKLLELSTVELYEELDIKVRRVVDVLWLVQEDEKDRVMSPGDDDMLKNALEELKVMY